VSLHESNAQQAERTCLAIRGQAADDAAAFATNAFDISLRPLTRAAAIWDVPPWRQREMRPDEQTPDLAGIVQEIVSRPGWTASNAMAFLIQGAGRRVAHAAENPAGTSAWLRVVWSLDSQPLALVSASSVGDTCGVVLMFDRPVSQATAGNTNNYRLSGCAAVLAAAVAGDGSSVRLTTTGLRTGEVYRLTVSGVADLLAPPNYLAPGTERLFVCEPSPVRFVGRDTRTQGSWKAVYGRDAYTVVGGRASYSACAQIAPLAYASTTWAASTADPRAPLKDLEPPDRCAAAWLSQGGSSKSFSVQISLTDGLPHQVAVYCLDWDRLGRHQTVEVVDTDSGRVWDTQVLSTNSFAEGVYLVWVMRGRQTVRFTTPNANIRCVTSGVFVSPASLAGPAAMAPRMDSAPQTNAVVGEAYEYAIAALGEPKPGLIVTGLPAWLMRSGDALAGVPPEEGVYGPITIVATNGIRPDATQTFSIVAQSLARVAPSIEGTPPAYGTVGTKYGYSPVVRGTPAPALAVSGCPAWLTFEDNGFTGTPPGVGRFGPITLTADNGVAPAATQSFTIAVTAMQGADWPQWRGPGRDGVWTGALNLAAWPPRMLWSNSLEKGESGMAISDGRLYTMGRRLYGETGSNLVYCLDADTGSNLWTAGYLAGPSFGSYGPQATPAVAGREVYTFDDTGMLYCFDKTNGAVLWSASVDLGRPQYGYSGSPLVHGDLIVLNACGNAAAVSRTTRRVVWPAAPSGDGSYASVVEMTVQGRPLLLQQAADALKGIDPLTGTVAWSYGYESALVSGYSAADPVVFGDRVFLFENGAVTLQATTGSVSEVYPLDLAHSGSPFATPVAMGGFAYALNSAGNLVRIDLATGQADWSQPVSSQSRGSLVGARGQLIVLADGRLRVLEIGPAGFSDGGRSPVTVSADETETSYYGWTPPALYRGRVYCRVGRRIACYEMSAESTTPADGNGNGIADEWELRYFGTTNHSLAWYQTTDSDGDGMKDGHEYLAGTNPTNAASVLKFRRIALRGSSLDLGLDAAKDHWYSVRWCTALVEGAWMDYGRFLSTQDGPLTMAFTNPVTDVFFKIRAEP
jgi:outer membrane protein assembly factor BamB